MYVIAEVVQEQNLWWYQANDELLIYLIFLLRLRLHWPLEGSVCKDMHDLDLFFICSGVPASLTQLACSALAHLPGGVLPPLAVIRGGPDKSPARAGCWASCCA